DADVVDAVDHEVLDEADPSVRVVLDATHGVPADDGSVGHEGVGERDPHLVVSELADEASLGHGVTGVFAPDQPAVLVVVEGGGGVGSDGAGRGGDRRETQPVEGEGGRHDDEYGGPRT